MLFATVLYSAVGFGSRTSVLLREQGTPVTENRINFVIICCIFET